MQAKSPPSQTSEPPTLSAPWFDGSLLRQARKQRGLTQKEISSQTGLSRNQIIAMEKGIFTGGLKYLQRYLALMDLKLELVEQHKTYPQFEELPALFKEDDE